METKLHRLSRVRPKRAEDSPDSIKRSKAINMNERARGQQVLLEAQGHRNASYKYLMERERNKRYNFGNQWGDIVSVDGVKMTEEEYIKKQGSVPLTTNLIRRLTKNVIGTYRERSAEPLCQARDRDEQMEAETLSTLLQYNMQLNHMGELNARTMEEYLIGGLVVHKDTFRWRNGRKDCWTDIVPPDSFIPDSNMRDVRGWDCTFVGQIHDYDFNTLVSEYAKTPKDYERLATIYQWARDIRSGQLTWEQFGYKRGSIVGDLLMPNDPSRCRVIEVWRKESKPRYRCHDWATGTLYPIEIGDYDALVRTENLRRQQQGLSEGIPEDEIPYIEVEWFMDSYWYYYFLSPFGDILDEGETPYDHKSHPFVFKAYPFLDGEIHSFVNDVIDQQRYTNRLITLNDMIIRSAAKGLLVVPRGCVPGLTEEQIGKIWAKPNGVLVVDPDKMGNLPKQITSSLTNIGIHEMLSLQLKFFEDISGVNGAMQGKAAFAGESGAHAQVMMQNAATSLVDILESFSDFECEEAYKIVKNIQQNYTEKDVYNIVGRTAKGFPVNPQKVLTTEVDISVSPSKKTPVYRAMANEFYMALFEKNAINVEQLLESVSDIPYADELLQSIRSQRQQVEQGQMPEGINPELLQKVQAGLNPNQQAMEQLQQIVGMPYQQAA